ncbi:hypothetical protein Asi02nite_40590 [Asanoa siamensis]|uniref:Uncharacterized protein n=1 Tax=Asanoa siamensis TaxID=926357 RepID=A0ABQ4CTD2_9ACTN|nr:hypothetical protein Asi02nite_40590 [Asanoa siamensis]
MIAFASVDSCGLLATAVATGWLAIDETLPAPELGSEEQPGPKTWPPPPAVLVPVGWGLPVAPPGDVAVAPPVG